MINKKEAQKERQDEIKTAIYDILGHGVQFDVDCTMSLMIANKPIIAKQRIESLQLKLQTLEILLNELINETKITINFKS